jgi:Zn-dependent protease with chaperone function
MRLLALLTLTTILGLAAFAPARAEAAPTPEPEAKVSDPHDAGDATAASPASPPARITEYRLPPEIHAKAHMRRRIMFTSALVGTALLPLLLWVSLRRRWSATFRDRAERLSRRRFVQAAIYTPLLVATLAVLQLPLAIFDHAVLKHYGISVQSWGSWLGDWAKFLVIQLIVFTPLVWILYAVIRRSPRRWWLAFWVISIPIIAFVFFVYPIAVDPLFNEFEPLQSKAPEIVPELQWVCLRAGVDIPPERMFWMKASVKSVVPNAYVTGFGATKRIVVWDTTLAQETTDGLLVTFGHELGHYALGHVWKGILWFLGIAFVLLYLGYRTIGWLLARHGESWGVRGLDDWASLPALLILIVVFGFAGTVAGNAVSRYVETQADIYGLEVTRGIVPDPGQAAAISFQKYGEKVFVDPDPPALDVLLFFDHPTVADRIRLFATYDPWSRGEAPLYVK